MHDDPTVPTLHGDGFALRVLALGDVDEWLAGDDAEQQRWFESPRPANRDDVVRAVTNWRASWATSGPVRQWGIGLVPGATLVGGVELRDRGDGRANISYVVFPSARRRGLATGAVRCASAWAFENLPVDATVAVIDEQNSASLGVVQAAGFVADGTADASEHRSARVMLRYRLDRP